MIFPCLADIVFAEETSTFSFPEVRRGLVPGMVSLAAKQRIPEHVCKRLMLTGEQVGGSDAFHLGIVDHLVDDVQSVERLLLGKISDSLGLGEHAKSLVKACSWSEALYKCLWHVHQERSTGVSASSCLGVSTEIKNNVCTMSITDETHFSAGPEIEKAILNLVHELESARARGDFCALVIHIAGPTTLLGDKGCWQGG
jgi:hypothetical protein